MARRILVVDDEPHVTRLMKQRLRREGYLVEVAHNGLDALTCLTDDGPFDVVITDYNMPKMDGRQLCEAILERFAGEEIYVFLVTGRLEERLLKWVESMPSIEYVEKPVSLQDLCRRLAKCFAHREGEPRDGQDA